MTTQHTRSRVASSFDWLTVSLVLGGVLLLYYLVPMVSLFLSVPAGDVLTRMTNPTVVNVATTSLLGASISTALAMVFGLPLAFWLARATVRWKSVVTAIVVLPLVLPPTVSGIVLRTVFGPNTSIGQWAAAAGVQTWRSLAGIVLAQTFVASPFVVVTAKSAFEGVDRTLEHASRSLGKGRLTTMRRVTIPLALPGIVAGVTLAFARAMGEFGATMMMAYYPKTMPVQIWLAFQELGLNNAYPTAILLVLISIAILAILNTIAANPWG